MATFRQHHTGEIHSTIGDDETAELEADALWQRLDDDDPQAESDSEPQTRTRTRKS